MANPKPTPRTPSSVWASRQVTVRVPVNVAEAIDTMKREARTTTEATLTLGHWLMLGMEAERRASKQGGNEDGLEPDNSGEIIINLLL